jgi:hypothetical protein
MNTFLSISCDQVDDLASARSSEPLKKPAFGTAISLVLLLFAAFCHLHAATVSVTNYVAPGQLIDSREDSIAVQAEYDFKANQSNAPAVTRELRFRLLDPSGSPVALNVAGSSQPFLTVNDVFNNPFAEKQELVGDNTLGKLVLAQGSVFYGSLSYVMGNLGVTVEAKRTENFSFRVDPNLTLLRGMINFLTPLNRQNTFRLTARYSPAALDISEMAYNFDVRYKFSKALSANVNFSDIKTLEGDRLFQEIFTELIYKYKRKKNYINFFYIK